jgi:Rieske Fe-S protein
MANIGKIATAWAGTSGGPGITQMYVEDIGSAALTQSQAQTAVNAMRTFWNALITLLPDELVLTVQPVVDQYDPQEGTLQGTITAATAPASVGGTSTAGYSMAAGFKVNLQTNNIRNGRRVRGSIFVVPASSSAYSNVGTIASATRTTINSAAATMLSTIVTANMNIIVWGRPLRDDQGALLRNGTVNYVQSLETNEKSAILRGRRD